MPRRDRPSLPSMRPAPAGRTQAGRAAAAAPSSALRLPFAPLLGRPAAAAPPRPPPLHTPPSMGMLPCTGRRHVAILGIALRARLAGPRRRRGCCLRDCRLPARRRRPHVGLHISRHRRPRGRRRRHHRGLHFHTSPSPAAGAGAVHVRRCNTSAVWRPPLERSPMCRPPFALGRPPPSRPARLRPARLRPCRARTARPRQRVARPFGGRASRSPQENSRRPGASRQRSYLRAFSAPA